MSSMKILGFAGLVLTMSLFITENADAQRRDRVRARRHGRVVVVTRRPVHRVVVRRAHVRYVGMPRWGTVVTVAPAGAVIIQHGPNPYYFDRGVYYVNRGPGFAVVRPVPGVRIRVLPVGYRTVVVGPRNYYYYYGTFYVKSNSSDEYIVADAPEGAVVDALPEGYEVKTVGDSEYYVLDGVEYAEVDAPEFDDGVGYQVVKV
jgi:hypothetical protein